MKVLIVANNCSTRMGGEAILPYHYFRIMGKKNIPSVLLTHERNQKELQELFPDRQGDIHYLKDTRLQKALWKMGSKLPQRLAEVSFFFFVFLIDNVRTQKVAKQLVKSESVTLVHQVIPVSPKEPSALHSVGVPVVMGPMNGGMEFPPGFRHSLSPLEVLVYRIGKGMASLLNLLIPGKRKASVLLYANPRTQAAFPRVLSHVPQREMVENGVDLSLWDPKKFPKSDKGPVFTFVGRLVDWKGVNYLLEAVVEARKVEPVTLQVVGTGPELPKLQALSKELGLEDAVTFLGFVDQGKVPEILCQSRALVLPSIYECGGAVVLEAMALRTAVLATRWGGPADYLDESCGILIDPESPPQFVADLAKGLITLARDAELGKKLGEAGRKKVQEEYDWDRKVESMVEIYRSVGSR